MPARTVVEFARAADDLGYSTAWLPDHVLPPGEFGATFGGVYEPLATIGYLAARTERLRLGTSVLIAPLRDPFLLAKQVATLQELSGGRVILGVGVGWSVPEFEALGADYRRRGAVTDDALELLRHLFSGGSAPYDGRRFSYERGVFAPVPQTPVPILVGGNSDAAIRRAARYGDIWQGLPRDPAAFGERVSALAKAAGDREVVPALRLRWDGDTPVEELVETIEAYRTAGAQQLAVHFGEYEGTADRMAALADAVASLG